MDELSNKDYKRLDNLIYSVRKFGGKRYVIIHEYKFGSMTSEGSLYTEVTDGFEQILFSEYTEQAGIIGRKDGKGCTHCIFHAIGFAINEDKNKPQEASIGHLGGGELPKEESKRDQLSGSATPDILRGGRESEYGDMKSITLPAIQSPSKSMLNPSKDSQDFGSEITKREKQSFSGEEVNYIPSHIKSNVSDFW